MTTTTHADVHTQLKDALGKPMGLRERGEYEKALEYHETTAGFFDDPAYRRRLLNGKGMSHMGLHQYAQAESAYREALAIPVCEAWELSEIAAIEGNLASALIPQSRTAEAHALLDASIATLEQVYEHEDWLGDKWECRARVFMKEGKYLDALTAAGRAYDILKFCFDRPALGRAIRMLNMAWDECERAGLFSVHTEATR